MKHCVHFEQATVILLKMVVMKKGNYIIGVLILPDKVAADSQGGQSHIKSTLAVCAEPAAVCLFTHDCTARSSTNHIGVAIH